MSDQASTEELLGQEYRAAHTSSISHQLARDVVLVSGEDAASYLQGQCSQDVADLELGATADALLLSPQGKIDAFVRITRIKPDQFVIDTDEGYGSTVVSRLERFRLRVKVDFEVLPWACVAVRGPKASASLADHPEVLAPVAWPGLTGFDLLGPVPDGGTAVWFADDVVVACGLEAWEALRIEAGVPVSGREITEGSIAAEVGLVERTVSFTKGCFTGQELVARLDARGSNVARRLCAVVFDHANGQASAHGREAELVGATVLTTDREHEVGHLSSVAWSPGRSATVALATLHRRVVPPEAVVITWNGADGAPLEVTANALPLPIA